MTWHDRYNPVRAIRTERYKYVRNFSALPRVFVPMDVVPTPVGREVHEEFYVEQRPAEELYDLEADSYEQTNLASDRTPFILRRKPTNTTRTTPTSSNCFAKNCWRGWSTPTIHCSTDPVPYQAVE